MMFLEENGGNGLSWSDINGCPGGAGGAGTVTIGTIVGGYYTDLDV